MKTIHDFISLKPFSREELEAIMDLAETFEDIARGKKQSNLLAGKVLATLFYEPSTRTRLSFETAMLRLGGQVLSTVDAFRTSSAWKGESIADTVRTVQNYADAIVIRHPERGAAEVAAKYADVPVFNGGDDANEHPTQGILDLLTIRRERGTIDGLTIAMIGDNKHCRSNYSVADALAHYNARLILVNPPELSMRPEAVELVRSKGHLTVEETSDLPAALKQADVMYIVRVQKERYADPAEYERAKGLYKVDRAMLEAAGRPITVLHPMPRVDELAEDVDDYPGACYFRESFNGVLIRMALLSLVLGKAQLP
ncbi:MAG: aspartate carbamoyltransferase [Chloroflexi bacterium]|nr:aspartate carbamoyltransferase [Chloroflexota bacterium]